MRQLLFVAGAGVERQWMSRRRAYGGASTIRHLEEMISGALCERFSQKGGTRPCNCARMGTLTVMKDVCEIARLG